jgi:hypothetical protein
MRTSLNEIKEIDNYLLGQTDPAEKFVFDVKLLLSDELAEKVQLQRKVYALIALYGRENLRKEIEMVHRKLFHKPEYRSFRKRVLNIFSNSK